MYAIRSYYDPFVALGLALVLAGLGFKIAAVPFHMWVPDAYQAANIPFVAWLSVAPKAAGFLVIAAPDVSADSRWAGSAGTWVV